ncbi:hypothetical protein CBER1_02800 [Cercospora berteroae]|uniref:FAD-binding domain-containing protein n=1 Tax=Cercospora berteroae TaxID=357750 RepID=A0A2S6CBY8_9PEZI|nr:hypothetical protein CBER1_02800 [Cercospora berteroae]
MTATTRRPILISGAGPASLLLARSLLRSSIPFLIFERDQSISFRGQGYRLRLSSEGLDAIEDVLGPEPEGFPKFWAACSKTGGTRGFGAINALTGEIIEDVWERPAVQAQPQPTKEILASRDGKTIGISRGEMRALFLEGCESYIKWGHQVTGYELTPDGVQAVFKDGSKSEEGSLLVAGDGIYSKVAKQVSQGRIKTFDTGARGIHGQASTTAFKGLDEGVWRILDESRPDSRVGVITNVRPNDMNNPDVEFGWTMNGQSGVIKPPNDDFAIIGKPAADIARSLTANWHPRVKPMFDQINEDQAAFWKITCSSPSGVPKWPNEQRVTVMGDSVHSMTPAGGIGANTAVRDSALLGQLLREAGGWAEDITASYEKQMRIYASEAVAISYGLATTGLGIKIDEETTPTVG